MNVFGELFGTLTAPGTLSGELSAPEGISGLLTIPSAVGVDVYDGPYEVTPSQQIQTLQTLNKQLAQNVVINPIPSNYGLITWDGSTLTVS